MVNLNNLFSLIQDKGAAKKLSDATGISTGNISDWKSGRSMPSAIKLVLIADYFDCSVDYLLGRTNNPAGYYQNFQAGNINLGDVNSSHVNVGNEVIASAASQLNDEILIEIQKILDNLTLQQKGKFIDYIYKFEK